MFGIDRAIPKIGSVLLACMMMSSDRGPVKLAVYEADHDNERLVAHSRERKDYGSLMRYHVRSRDSNGMLPLSFRAQS